MTARPPAHSTASEMAGSAQATITGPISAASARSSTCTIIGRPAMSASGLPGRRVEAMRAGISTMGFRGGSLVVLPETLIRLAVPIGQPAVTGTVAARSQASVALSSASRGASVSATRA